MTSKTSPLWAADGVVVDDFIVDFCRGEDQLLDATLLDADLRGTAAHVKGLHAIGILSDEEEKELSAEIQRMRSEREADTLKLSEDDEDGHSCIERILTERLGDLGKKVHTGRSRNDQVLVATRLWLKDQLAQLQTSVLAAAEALLKQAEANQDMLMPGFTHLQRAVPSTVGFWFAGHAECFIEDAAALAAAEKWINRSPLGTAAGYGVNLDLPREAVARELGFDGVVMNGLCAQNGRGRIEAHVLSAVVTVMSSIRRFAWDVSLFTTSEFDFVKLPDRWCTGSSIMPNKKNPDVLELMRASFASVAGHHQMLLHAQALPSAYHRDLQVTKGPMVRAMQSAQSVTRLLPPLVADIAFNEENLRQAHDPAMLATDLAVEKTAGGMSFRDAYRSVKAELSKSGGDGNADYSQSISARTSLGSPGNLGLAQLNDRLKAAMSS